MPPCTYSRAPMQPPRAPFLVLALAHTTAIRDALCAKFRAHFGRLGFPTACFAVLAADSTSATAALPGASRGSGDATSVSNVGARGMAVRTPSAPRDGKKTSRQRSDGTVRSSGCTEGSDTDDGDAVWRRSEVAGAPAAARLLSCMACFVFGLFQSMGPAMVQASAGLGPCLIVRMAPFSTHGRIFHWLMGVGDAGLEGCVPTSDAPTHRRGPPRSRALLLGAVTCPPARAPPAVRARHDCDAAGLLERCGGWGKEEWRGREKSEETADRWRRTLRLGRIRKRGGWNFPFAFKATRRGGLSSGAGGPNWKRRGETEYHTAWLSLALTRPLERSAATTRTVTQSSACFGESSMSTFRGRWPNSWATFHPSSTSSACRRCAGVWRAEQWFSQRSAANRPAFRS